MNDNFSKNLRKLRLEKKLTQEQVAEKLGVSAQSVSRWETGATFPDVMMLPEISSLYGVLVDDLFKDPTGYGVYENLAGRLLAVYEDTYKHEDFMAAAMEYERMVKEGTMTADDYRCYGALHARMLQVCKKKTLEYLDKALELCEDNDPKLYFMVKYGKVGFRCAHTAEGPQCIEEQLHAVKEHPEDSREWAYLEVAYYETKKYEECYQVAKEAIAKFPEDSELYCLAGDACKELGKYEEAYLYWEKRHELDPWMLDSLYSIAFCREELEEYDKAYEAWMRIADILNERKDEIGAKFPMRRAEGCKTKMGKKE
ncbi:MAG: helix-turn-helix domain-containing protein [Lachnospiraceae bacterium]|nr:helix-turn-helix domain-containing protein [Lachnospiraceae bacterium]